MNTEAVKKTRLMSTNLMLMPGTVDRCREWGSGLDLSASEVVRVAVERLLKTAPPTPLNDDLISR